VELQVAVALADVAVADLDDLAGLELLDEVGLVVPKCYAHATRLVADGEVGDPPLRAVVAVERADRVRVEHLPDEVHVGGTEREVLHPIGVEHLHVDLGVLVRLDLVRAHFESAVPLFRAAHDAEHLSDLQLLFGRGCHIVPQCDAHGAGGVRHVDVADAALLGVLVVALERADVADGGHLPEELHVVHAGLDVGDRVGLLVAQLVGDEHGRGLLVGESAHLLHFVLDGCLEFLELDIGVEILVDVLYHSHTRTTSVVESADKRCLCRGLAAESDRLFCGFRGVAVAGRGFVIPVHRSRRYKGVQSGSAPMNLRAPLFPLRAPLLSVRLSGDRS